LHDGVSTGGLLQEKPPTVERDTKIDREQQTDLTVWRYCQRQR